MKRQACPTFLCQKSDAANRTKKHEKQSHALDGKEQKDVITTADTEQGPVNAERPTYSSASDVLPATDAACMRGRGRVGVKLN